MNAFGLVALIAALFGTALFVIGVLVAIYYGGTLSGATTGEFTIFALMFTVTAIAAYTKDEP